MESIIEIMPYIWGAIVVLTIIIEFLTITVDSIWFSISSFIALLLSIFKIHIIIQISVFFIVSMLLMFTIGRWTKKLLLVKNVATNTDYLIGKEINVLEDASYDDKGSGIINDVVWTLICPKNENVKKGEKATIIAIEGNKLIVKKGE